MSYAVSVRALCQFTAKTGDLDMRFTPAPSAQEGIAGHRIVASRRGPHYRAEVSLKTEQAPLTIRGRADGYDDHACRLEECKTFRGDLTRMPSNHRALHWAQVQTYGAQLCRRDGLEAITLSLVYFDVDNKEETVLSERYTAEALEELLIKRATTFSNWAEQELEHRAARDAQLAGLQFPFEEFHGGQRALADAVYRAAARAETLLAQAPTGVGKTVGTLFPMLKAMSLSKIDKIFYLTAKSTGRPLAIDAMKLLKRSAPQVRVLDLVAREKACAQPGKACNAESCPLARGFYDKLPNARVAALGLDVMDQAGIRSVASQHELCPYYLSQEMVRWSDVVVGDYNYYFDYGGLLHTMTLENDWNVGLLIDEAHNLIERGRDMYSAELQWTRLHDARTAAPSSLKTALDNVRKQWDAFAQHQESQFAVYEDIPKQVLMPLTAAVQRIGEYAVRNADALPVALRDFYFSALTFNRLSEHFNTHSMCDMTRSTNGDPQSLHIRSIVPGNFLRTKFQDAHCAVLFSATLSPPHFYRDVLGLPSETQWLDAPSPFASDQLDVYVAANISTRYRQRGASAISVVELVERQYRSTPGNYIFFASSFEYLVQIFTLFTLRNRDIPSWTQSSGMSEINRTAFINRFTATSQGIGFAVLGGAFAEGIDLPGARLIGAFVATIGLPQFNPVNEMMRHRLDEQFGDGDRYAYLYPGIRKVIQAAGRVIRTKTDSGSVHLIDERYGSDDILGLLPKWWHVKDHADATE